MEMNDCVRALSGLTDSYRLVPNCDICGIANSSRDVGKNYLFCAIRGSRADGHRFIPDAIEKGASLILVSCDYDASQIPEDISWIKVNDSYFAWACICEEFFGRPADALDVHAVTGTNGKTSTAFLLRHFLTDKTASCGMLSTVVTDTGDAAEEEAAGTTMPDAFALQRLFLRAKENGCRDIVMEASSHGLHQHRAGRLKFASAVFTNLSGDHLDYHNTMEEYYDVKKSLFTEMMRENAPAAINIDDDWGKRLYAELSAAKIPLRLLPLSDRDDAAFCFIKSIGLSASGTDISFRIDGHDLTVHSPLLGEHNVRNLLCAFTIAYALGIPLPDLAEKITNAPPTPGRLQSVRLATGALAFVDYAHTDDALYRALAALRKLNSNARIIAVFGCGGDRDKTKRPRMGKVASELSDVVIITSDNPRSEDPIAIISDIEKGIAPGKNYLSIPDRAEAIEKAVGLSKQGDLILVAGKGHENYQEVNGTRHHFDDMEILTSYTK